MHEFSVKFARYKNGEGRISSMMFLRAEDFRAAHEAADRVLFGLKQGDPAATFSINSIQAIGFRGIDCEGGTRLFETEEELSDRLARVSQ